MRRAYLLTILIFSHLVALAQLVAYLSLKHPFYLLVPLFPATSYFAMIIRIEVAEAFLCEITMVFIKTKKNIVIYKLNKSMNY